MSRMTSSEEENCVKIVIPSQPIIKPAIMELQPLELKNIGYLKKMSTYVNCPSCLAECMSVVRLEAVTCWQRFLVFTKMCKTAESRYDINHYCGICGCYIGRYLPIGCYEEWLSKRARRLAAKDAMTLRPEPRDCCRKMQEARQRISENMEKEREERKRKQQETEEEPNGK